MWLSYTFICDYILNLNPEKHRSSWWFDFFFFSSEHISVLYETQHTSHLCSLAFVGSPCSASLPQLKAFLHEGINGFDFSVIKHGWQQEWKVLYWLAFHSNRKPRGSPCGGTRLAETSERQLYIVQQPWVSATAASAAKLWVVYN